MVTCPVCGAENDPFAVVCVSCKGFVQAKVDTLDLFRTIWGLMESPRAAFRRIAIAKTKNYAVVLAGVFGIAVAFAAMWQQNAGARFPQLAVLTGLGVLVGVPLGILLILALAAFLVVSVRVAGGKTGYRNMFAVSAYAGVPVVMSLVCIFPLEVAIFGVYFFDRNPPPMMINPVAYTVLLGFDAAAGIWSCVLLATGTSVAGGIGWLKAAAASVVVPGLVVLAIIGLSMT